MARQFKNLERIVRGFSNHRRIEMLYLLEDRPDLDLTAISRALGMNFKTCHEHAQRLSTSGLVYKRPKKTNVLHRLSPWGKKTLVFLRTLEN